MNKKYATFIGRKLLTTFITVVMVTVLITLFLFPEETDVLRLEKVSDSYFFISLIVAIYAGTLLIFFGLLFSVVIELLTMRWFPKNWMYVLLHAIFGFVFAVLSNGFSLFVISMTVATALIYVGIDRVIYKWANNTVNWLIMSFFPIALYFFGLGIYILEA
ncbi:hypothetical protein [Lentibacillus saliphilus]|uniref:hypothetical protein n=1 Tax=Lentibacillus saliphilus TaxID=2737028 RepID=UPI001C30B225|nr:hypothetical protein [Lentibacillus saliphilus]